MPLLVVETLMLILFVALALIAGKCLLVAERRGVGVSGIMRRSARDGFVRFYDNRRHGGAADDPMHLRDELPPLPFRPQDGGDEHRPQGRRFPGAPGV